MKTFVMTTATMSGEIIFTYNEVGTLAQLSFSEPVTEEHYLWLFAHMPWNMELIPALRACAKKSLILEKRMEVTFDMFWNRYNDKERSSKKKTQVLWEKMTEGNQIKAYLYLPTYNRKRGTAEKKYATTYLNDELWNN